jgi:hypothetical protein
MRIISLLVIMAAAALVMTGGCKKDGDKNSPYIVINPPALLVWPVDVPYVDPGAEAFDITEAGDTINITDRLQTNDNVDAGTVGDYVVRYNVTDEAGNAAEEQTRDVRVVITK